MCLVFMGNLVVWLGRVVHNQGLLGRSEICILKNYHLLIFSKTGTIAETSFILFAMKLFAVPDCL